MHRKASCNHPLSVHCIWTVPLTHTWSTNTWTDTTGNHQEITKTTLRNTNGKFKMLRSVEYQDQLQILPFQNSWNLPWNFCVTTKKFRRSNTEIMHNQIIPGSKRKGKCFITHSTSDKKRNRGRWVSVWIARNNPQQNLSMQISSFQLWYDTAKRWRGIQITL